MKKLLPQYTRVYRIGVCKYHKKMPFFTRPKQRKNIKTPQVKRKIRPAKSRNGTDQIISSEEDASDEGKREDEYSSEEETHQEKKLRLTKKYLKELEEEEKSKIADGDDTKAAVGHRLKEIALEEAGRLQRNIAKDYETAKLEQVLILKAHNKSVTCLTVSNSEKYVFSGAKDSQLIKWCLETGKRLKVIQRVKKGEKKSVGHQKEIQAIAISNDDKFLASGCAAMIINIWNPEDMSLLKTFKGHRGTISGLKFTRGSHQLISSSTDRSLKLWNLDEMGYVETLFGHQDAISSLDAFQSETAISSGARDNTIRIWKLVEESQLVYQGHGCSIDCVCVSSPQHFVSGADDGSLSLWGLNKKKPLSRTALAHGREEESENPNWITALCAMPNTDLLASGSQDGQIRLWKRNDEKRVLEPVSSIPAEGFVNAMCFTPSGKYLLAALGQTHKYGRWWNHKKAKNIIIVVKFPEIKR